MTDKQKQALRVLERLLDVNGEPIITKNEWLLLFDFVIGNVESITLTIPKDLKGTDPDGGVVGEKGEEGEAPFKEYMENLKKRIEDNQLGCIVQRLDKIIELLQEAILVIPKETFGSDYDIDIDKIKQDETNKPKS